MLVAEEGPTTKTKPLRKQRSKPQVSEVFCSVSIDLYADGINPMPNTFIRAAKMLERNVEVVGQWQSLAINEVLLGDRSFPHV